MKNKTLFLMASICSAALLISGCTMCPSRVHNSHQDQKTQEKHHHKKSDAKKAHAKMYTRSRHGGESEMGFIKFKETENGLTMNVDLIDLRPGKTYTAQIYQCNTCDNGICCNDIAMDVELPKIKIPKKGRLQESYVIQGLNATQLNNAKLILTRDGGHKAAWGTLN